MPGGLLDMFGIDPVANRQRRDRSAELDKTIAGELARTKLANQGLLDVEGLRGKNDISNTRERGNQDRLTNAQQNEITKALEVLRSNNLLTEKEHDQKLKFMSDLGVPYSKENLKTADSAITDSRIRKALQADQQIIQARQAPGFATTLAQGLQAQNLAPAFANIQAGKMTAGPGDLVAVPPSGVELPPTDLNAWGGMHGGGKKDVISQIPSSIPGMPPSTQVTTETTPGRIKVNPALMQQAMQQVAPAPAATDIPGNVQQTEDPLQQMLTRWRLMQALGMPQR